MDQPLVDVEAPAPLVASETRQRDTSGRFVKREPADVGLSHEKAFNEASDRFFAAARGDSIGEQAASQRAEEEAVTTTEVAASEPEAPAATAAPAAPAAAQAPDLVSKQIEALSAAVQKLVEAQTPKAPPKQAFDLGAKLKEFREKLDDETGAQLSDLLTAYDGEVRSQNAALAERLEALEQSTRAASAKSQIDSARSKLEAIDARVKEPARWKELAERAMWLNRDGAYEDAEELLHDALGSVSRKWPAAPAKQEAPAAPKPKPNGNPITDTSRGGSKVKGDIFDRAFDLTIRRGLSYEEARNALRN